MRTITIKTNGATITRVIAEPLDSILWYAENDYQKNKKEETLGVIKKLKELNEKYRPKTRGR